MAVAILGFGLASCSKETEIRYQEDQFQPRDILVEKSDKSFTALNNLTNLDYSRQLVISDENTSDGNQIKNLVLSTNCRAQSSSASSNLNSQWPNPKKVDVLEILPDDILLYRGKEIVYCELNYTTTNGFNSTNTGKVKHVKIENMNSFSNLAANHPLAQEKVIWSTVTDGTLVPLENAITTITCSDFSHTSSDLPLSATKEQFLPSEVYSQNTVKSPVQTCRALFRTKNQIALSPVFQLHLPVIAPVITYSFSKRVATYVPIDASHTVTYKIQNQNPYPISISVDASAAQLSVRAILYSANNYIPSTPQQFPIVWSLNGQPAKNVQSFEVGARSSIEWIGSLQGNIDCSNAMSRNIAIVGTNSDLTSPISFKFKNSSDQEQTELGSYIGTTYNSISNLRHWDIALNWVSDPSATVEGVVAWVRWHQVFDIYPNTGVTNALCVRN